MKLFIALSFFLPILLAQSTGLYGITPNPIRLELINPTTAQMTSIGGIIEQSDDFSGVSCIDEVHDIFYFLADNGTFFAQGVALSNGAMVLNKPLPAGTDSGPTIAYDQTTNSLIISLRYKSAPVGVWTVYEMAIPAGTIKFVANFTNVARPGADTAIAFNYNARILYTTWERNNLPAIGIVNMNTGAVSYISGSEGGFWMQTMVYDANDGLIWGYGQATALNETTALMSLNPSTNSLKTVSVLPQLFKGISWTISTIDRTNGILYGIIVTSAVSLNLVGTSINTGAVVTSPGCTVCANNLQFLN